MKKQIKLTKEELTERIMAGDIIYTENNNRLVYNESFIYSGMSPYRIRFNSGKSNPINSTWTDGTYYIDQNWWDDVSPESPMACMVRNKNAFSEAKLRWVYKKAGIKFMAYDNGMKKGDKIASWDIAEPINQCIKE